MTGYTTGGAGGSDGWLRATSSSSSSWATRRLSAATVALPLGSPDASDGGGDGLDRTTLVTRASSGGSTLLTVTRPFVSTYV